MIAFKACRVGFSIKPTPADIIIHNPFGQWRTANISETDKQYLHLNNNISVVIFPLQVGEDRLHLNLFIQVFNVDPELLVGVDQVVDGPAGM